MQNGSGQGPTKSFFKYGTKTQHQTYHKINYTTAQIIPQERVYTAVLKIS
jgi:hypothetical protein